MLNLDGIRDIDSGEMRFRIAQRLLQLRKKLKLYVRQDGKTTGVPERQIRNKLLLASWNLREFGSQKFGGRTPEAYYYIAEILSRFDLIAIQEVRDNLDAFYRVHEIMGPPWEYLISPVTRGTRGNYERLAFLFDPRTVGFSGVAGHVVIPPDERKQARKVIYAPSDQPYRSPYFAGFQVGSLKFMLCTVHVLYGTSRANDPERAAEIDSISKFLAKHSKDVTSWSRNIILLGDFNIFSTDSEAFQRLTANGFTVPETIQRLPTNLLRNKHYDQIAFRFPMHKVSSEEPGSSNNEVPPRVPLSFSAGTVDPFETVFKDDDEDSYAAHMGPRYRTFSNGKRKTKAEKTSFYRSMWRTYQMSDHQLLWLELRTDFTTERLLKIYDENLEFKPSDAKQVTSPPRRKK